MKTKTATLCLLLSFWIVACSSDDKCFVADSLEKITTLDIDNQKYQLYLRISGLQEKEAFYEIYGNNPIFDNCGRTDTPVVADTHIDISQGQTTQLIINDTIINITFAKDKSGKVNLTDIKVQQEQN